MEPTNLKYLNPSDTFLFYHNINPGHFNMRGSHFHKRYEIYYLVSGERYYFIDEQTYLIKKGDLVFIAPHIIHKTMDTGKPGYERFLIEFDQQFITNQVGNTPICLKILFGRKNIISLSLQKQQVIEKLLESMRQEIHTQSLDYENQLQSLLLQLLIYSARNLEEISLPRRQQINPTYAKVSEIVKFVNTHYHEKLTLSNVANHFQISHFYLSRLFKANTGFTFIEYLNSLRIKEAQRLLRESQNKVINIANQVGFENQSHFGRIFKEITGKSPLQYRKRIK